MSDADIIRLNVGGVSYSTTRQTLSSQPNSLLCRIVDGSSIPDSILSLPDGTIFIDRDGDLFTFVLHYLRAGKLALPDGFKDLCRLKDEADFYKLDQLYELCLEIEPLKTKQSNGGAFSSSGENGESHAFTQCRMTELVKRGKVINQFGSLPLRT